MTDIIELASEKLLPPSEALALLNGDQPAEANDPIQNLSPSLPPVEEVSFFGIRYGSFGLLFSDDVNKELVDQVDLREVPNGPSWLKGFTNIRGSITPVIDFSGVFDSAYQPPETTVFSKNYLLTIGKGAASFALPLNDFPEKLTFDLSHEHADQELAPEILRPYIEHCFRKDIPWFCFSQHNFLQHLKNQP